MFSDATIIARKNCAGKSKAKIQLQLCNCVVHIIDIGYLTRHSRIVLLYTLYDCSMKHAAPKKKVPLDTRPIHVSICSTTKPDKHQRSSRERCIAYLLIINLLFSLLLSYRNNNCNHIRHIRAHSSPASGEKRQKNSNRQLRHWISEASVKK